MRSFELWRSLTIVLIILFGFVSEGLTQSIDQVYGPVLPNVLSLEFTIGEDDNSVPPEFLLDRPLNFTVMNNGDIIIPDERRLKIFDKTGKAKIIVGNPGEGPGDLGEYPKIFSSSDELITVFHSNRRYPWYNVYDSEYKFLLRENHMYTDDLLNYFKDDNFRYSIREMKSFNENEHMYYFQATVLSRITKTSTYLGTPITNYFMLYIKGNEKKVIAHYGVENKIMNPNYQQGLTTSWDKPFFGNYLTAELSGKRYAYMHSAVDISESEGENYYTINIIDLQTFDIRSITLEYPKSIIPEKEKNIKIEYANRPELNKALEPFNEILSQIQEETVYYKPFQRMRSDRNFLFLFSHIKNEDDHIAAEIIDINTEERVAVAYFEIIPDIIKNGVAYNLYANEDGFSVLKQYKMNPAVYGN